MADVYPFLPVKSSVEWQVGEYRGFAPNVLSIIGEYGIRSRMNARRATAIAVLMTLTTAGWAGDKPRWQTCPLPPPTPAPAAHGRVASHGAQIYYATYGDSNNLPVILLHGGLGVSDHWSNQIPALIEVDRWVIAIDSRGHGRSTRPRASPSYSAMASDVIAVMDELTITQAAVVGWSDGGEVALKLAIEHPDRVAKLVVFGANYDAGGRKPHARSETFRIYTAKCRADYQRLSSTPTQFGVLIEWMLPVWRGASAITATQLRAITVPTLVIGADHDELIAAEHFSAMAALIPNATYTSLSDASHFAPWQVPAEFNALVIAFLQR